MEVDEPSPKLNGHTSTVKNKVRKAALPHLREGKSSHTQCNGLDEEEDNSRCYCSASTSNNNPVGMVAEDASPSDIVHSQAIIPLHHGHLPQQRPSVTSQTSAGMGYFPTSHTSTPSNSCCYVPDAARTMQITYPNVGKYQPEGDNTIRHMMPPLDSPPNYTDMGHHHGGQGNPHSHTHTLQP